VGRQSAHVYLKSNEEAVSNEEADEEAVSTLTGEELYGCMHECAWMWPTWEAKYD
jgi:hypothetical protein